MTVIATTAAQAGRVMPREADVVISVKLAESVEALVAAYQTTSGTFGIADANAAGKQQFRGVYLKSGGAGQVVPLLVRGPVYGYTVSSLNGDAVLYLSDTAGDLDDSAGTLTVVAGRVFALPDGTKVAWIDANWAYIWA